MKVAIEVSDREAVRLRDRLVYLGTLKGLGFSRAMSISDQIAARVYYALLDTWEQEEAGGAGEAKDNEQ